MYVDMKNVRQKPIICASDQWHCDQVVVFDWFDGPRQGVARLAIPVFEFAFELLAERHNPDGLDDRLFRIFELPIGAVNNIITSLQTLGKPTNTVWVPIWKFEREVDRIKADFEIDTVLKGRNNAGLVIYSRDMISIGGCWQVEKDIADSQDWFSLLGIP